MAITNRRTLKDHSASEFVNNNHANDESGEYVGILMDILKDAEVVELLKYVHRVIHNFILVLSIIDMWCRRYCQVLKCTRRTKARFPSRSSLDLRRISESSQTSCPNPACLKCSIRFHRFITLQCIRCHKLSQLIGTVRIPQLSSTNTSSQSP